MKIPHLRWWIAGLLFLATVINYIDRQALSIVAPILTKELHLSPIQYANILAAFLWAYTAMYIVSGMLVDRWGTRRALAAFMTWWSVANMLHGFVTSAFGLGVFRFLLGVGEPGNFSAAQKATSEWYPVKERGFVNGLINAGAAVGAIISVPLVVWLERRYGWRSAFVITGALGLVWLVGWLGLYQLPERHPRITPVELALIRGSGATGEVRSKVSGYRDLLRLPQTWGLVLTRVLGAPVWWFYLFWLPKYLVEQRGFTMVEMGMLAWMPYLTADLGSVGGGLISGWMVQRGWPALRARTVAMIPFVAVMPVSVLIAFTPSRAVTMAAICTVTFSHMAWMTNLMTVTNDIYPKAVVGRMAGIASFGNGIGATLFNWLTGYIVQYFGYNTIFIMMGFMHPAGYLVYRLLVRGPIEEAT